MRVDQSPRLYVEEYGPPGHTLVFVPGLGGTTHYWQGHLGALEQTYHIVLVDPLGFGESPQPWMRYTVNAHVEALQQALHRYAPFVLVGHSMGSLLSLAYAARYPENVDGLVLLSLPYYGSKDQAIRTVRTSSPLYRVFLGNMVLAAVICMVTRRLYRSGESEYLINKQPCRLKDIRELFMDTGIGRSAYSVIEQGKVDVLLQSNPTERRAIFEEAAGISKYKARKREAERKLDRTEQNLLRVQDILEEIQKRLRSVKIQATKAKKIGRAHV